MRLLRYSINVTLDGCCDHRAIPVSRSNTRTLRYASPPFDTFGQDAAQDAGVITVVLSGEKRAADDDQAPE